MLSCRKEISTYPPATAQTRTRVEILHRDRIAGHTIPEQSCKEISGKTNFIVSAEEGNHF